MNHLVVGLGNPGDLYTETRHNVGRFLLEKIIKENLSSGADLKWHTDGQLEAKVVKFNQGEINFVWLLPETYMNMSGRSVSKFLKTGQSEVQKMIVIHDELDLPLGTIKISYGKSAGGHNGVQSIIDAIKTTDFVRVRVGVGRAGEAPWWEKIIGRQKGRGRDFVLKKFKKTELEILTGLSVMVLEILKTIGVSGREVAMNKFNQ